jgi:hypothetical protein
VLEAKLVIGKQHLAVVVVVAIMAAAAAEMMVAALVQMAAAAAAVDLVYYQQVVFVLGLQIQVMGTSQLRTLLVPEFQVPQIRDLFAKIR